MKWELVKKNILPNGKTRFRFCLPFVSHCLVLETQQELRVNISNGRQLYLEQVSQLEYFTIAVLVTTHAFKLLLLFPTEI